MSKRTAIYPGSFNLFHIGHNRVVHAGLDVFDKVIVAIGKNPAKPMTNLDERMTKIEVDLKLLIAQGHVEVVVFEGLLADYVNAYNDGCQPPIHAVIKGVRNAADLEDELTQLSYNQDLGIGIPTLLIPADHDVRHISSTAIRAIEAMRKK